MPWFGVGFTSPFAGSLVSVLIFMVLSGAILTRPSFCAPMSLRKDFLLSSLRHGLATAMVTKLPAVVLGIVNISF